VAERDGYTFNWRQCISHILSKEYINWGKFEFGFVGLFSSFIISDGFRLNLVLRIYITIRRATLILVQIGPICLIIFNRTYRKSQKRLIVQETSHVTYDTQFETLDILSCLMSPRTLTSEKTKQTSTCVS
jgi:hypothetical protein